MSAMEFHPLANLFPMLDEQQAEELASDVRANGLRQAITSDEFRAAELYVRPADKYFAAQEARLGPVEAAPMPKIGVALKTLLKDNRATLVSWVRQHHDAGIPAVLAALAASIAAIERQLAALATHIGTAVNAQVWDR